MEWTTVVIVAIGFLTGFVTGWVLCSANRHIKAPYAGNVIVDLRRECEDTIRIESPRAMSKWSKFNQLTFDVVVEYDKPTPVKDISRRK